MDIAYAVSSGVSNDSIGYTNNFALIPAARFWSVYSKFFLMDHPGGGYWVTVLLGSNVIAEVIVPVGLLPLLPQVSLLLGGDLAFCCIFFGGHSLGS